MADIKACFLIAFFATLFSIAHPQFSDYHQICRRTHQSNLCIQIIDASGNANLKKNANGWLQILSDDAKRLAILTNTKIGEAERSNPSPRLNQSLNFCATEYATVIFLLDNLEWINLNKGNYPEFRRRLVQTDLGVESCINNFNNPPPTESPITVFNVNTKNVIQLVLEVLNLNQCNKPEHCP